MPCHSISGPSPISVRCSNAVLRSTFVPPGIVYPPHHYADLCLIAVLGSLVFYPWSSPRLRWPLIIGMAAEHFVNIAILTAVRKAQGARSRRIHAPCVRHGAHPDVVRAVVVVRQASITRCKQVAAWVQAKGRPSRFSLCQPHQTDKERTPSGNRPVRRKARRPWCAPPLWLEWAPRGVGHARPKNSYFGECRCCDVASEDRFRTDSGRTNASRPNCCFAKDT